MFERFTQKCRDAVTQAQTEALSLGHDFIGTEHQLLGLLAIRTGVAFDVLTEAGVTHQAVLAQIKRVIGLGVDDEALATIGVDLAAIKEAIDESFGEGALERAMTSKPGCKGPTFTPRAKKVMELALREALSMKHNYIGTEHLLLAIVREDEGVASQVLIRLAPNVDFREAVTTRLRSGA